MRAACLATAAAAAFAGLATSAPSYGNETTSRLVPRTELLGAEAESIVHTTLGTVQGVILDNGYASARSFMAVPYAMSPQNASRWKPPAAAVSWSPYVLQALYDPPGCLQVRLGRVFSLTITSHHALTIPMIRTAADCSTRSATLSSHSRRFAARRRCRHTCARRGSRRTASS